MVDVGWICKNSVYDGVVQFVNISIKEIDGHGKATVLWRRKGRELDTWTEDDSSSQPKCKQS